MGFGNSSVLKLFKSLISYKILEDSKITKQKSIKKEKNKYKKSSSIIVAFKTKSDIELERIAEFRLPDLIIRIDNAIKRLKVNHIQVPEAPFDGLHNWSNSGPGSSANHSIIENSIISRHDAPKWQNPQATFDNDRGDSMFGAPSIDFEWHIEKSKIWCEILLDISVSLKLYLALKKFNYQRTNEDSNDSDRKETSDHDTGNNCQEDINLKVLCLPKQVLILKRELTKVYELYNFPDSAAIRANTQKKESDLYDSLKIKSRMRYSPCDREMVFVRILKDLRRITIILLDSLLCYLNEVDVDADNLSGLDGS